jgi:hypothetical protein
MLLEWAEGCPWDRSDARNAGVFLDSKVRTRTGQALRLVMYQVYEFLTNEPDLPPGVIAELYRRRWDSGKGV